MGDVAMVSGQVRSGHTIFAAVVLTKITGVLETSDNHFFVSPKIVLFVTSKKYYCKTIKNY